MEMKIFGLLHIAENEQSATNLRTRNFREQLAVYINNALVLAKSLSFQSIAFGLLTNNKLLIEEFASIAGNDFPLEVIEIPFVTKVPSNIPFFSAHHKIDAFRYLASLTDSYYALCDLDVVCTSALPACLHNIIKARIPLCYDISDQYIPAFGHEVIIRDLSIISRLDSEGRWSGGEFISGHPEFFKKLVSEIDDVYNDYLTHIPSLYHVGDEALTSSALERMRRQGIYIADAGNLFIIGRYWNTTTLHPQKPFSYFKCCFLLHLPADKKFLSNLARSKPDIFGDFTTIYEKHLGSFSSKFKNWARLLVRSMKRAANMITNRTHDPEQV